MPAQLLTTKLYIPPPRPGLVTRGHLIERLNAGLTGRLTLVSAPAGFGKTTLLSAWAAHSDRPCCWLSLDEGDNDPGRFLAYFVAALGTAGIQVDPEPLQLLANPGPGQIETVLNGIINQVAAAGTPLVAVLDDYHRIQQPAVHDILAYLLEHLPPGAHLVLLTRADPPLPIARYRARGQINELRAADLRFSLSEGEQFLNQVHQLAVADGDVAQLVQRTDGWVAGLQLASLALSGRPDPRDYIRRFSGSQDYIADFLTTEVLDQLAEEVRSFLLKTAILERLSAPLCAAITGQADSQEILKSLRHNNIFLQALDGEGRWYAYHQLFRDLLTQQLLSQYPQEVPGLYLGASTWCQQHALIHEAIEYALQGGHIQLAAGLIEDQAQATLERSEMATFIRWVERLPETSLKDRPNLWIDYAWATLVSNREAGSATRCLQQVQPVNDLGRGKLLCLSAIVAAMQRDVDQSLELSRQALDILPAEAHFFRQVTGWNLSAALFLSGDEAGGVAALEDVARVSLASGNRLVAVVTRCRLGNIYQQQGHLNQAYQIYQQALEIAGRGRVQPLPAACEALLGLGKIEWEWYQLESAADKLREGLALSRQWREVVATDGAITLAHLLLSQGDAAQSNQVIEEARGTVAQKTQAETGQVYLEMRAVHLQLRQQQLDRAEAWVRQRGLAQYLQPGTLDEALGRGTGVLRALELGVYSRVLLAGNAYTQALALLEGLLRVLSPDRQRAQTIEAHLLKALALEGSGDRPGALQSIEKSLTLAAPGGYRRVFLDEDPAALVLMRALSCRGDIRRFAQEVLALSAGENSGHSDSPATLDEPLTEREIEVLQWLESELPVPEIAARLHISTSTLRTHIRNIYRKLETHSRFEAVSKAGDLNLR